MRHTDNNIYAQPRRILYGAVASRPTAGRLGHVLADWQSVVQADGQPAPAQRQVAG